VADEPPVGAPLEPVSDDPILLTDFLQLLSVKGKVGQLRVANIILPTVSLGDVATPHINVRTPAFRSTDVFSNGIQAAPAIGTVLADTGQLPAGTYDVGFLCASNEDSNNSQSIVLEHRNAANAANLALWHHMTLSVAVKTVIWPFYTFGYELATNERLRAINNIAGATLRTFNAVIFARIRE
jgi:hypothetical protein